MTRRILPNRRRCELVTFEHGGIRYTGTISRFPDGNVAEVFLHTQKPGSGLADAARDVAVAASLALQFGCPTETLRHALTRLHDGTAAGPLGALLGMIEGAENGAAP